MAESYNESDQAKRASASSSSATNIPPSHQASSGSEAHATPQALSPPRPSNASGSNKLLFLNYSNPSEFKSRSNKRIVKRWASISGHRSASQATDQELPPQRTLSSAGYADPSPAGSATASHAPDAEIQKRSGASIQGPSPRPPPTTPRPQPAVSTLTTSSSDIAPTSDSSGSRNSSDHASRIKQRDARRSSAKSSKSSSDEPKALRRILPASSSSSDSSLSLAIEKVGRDPFDVLPVKTDAHAHELLRLYLNASLLSPTWTAVEEDATEFQSSLASLRKTFWFPLVRNSTAALAALMAYIECTPGLTSSTNKRGFLENYQSLALRKANSELADPKLATSDSTMFAVVLLMIGAQRVNDLATFRIHARGLSLILKQRREDRRRKSRHVSDFGHCFDASTAALATRTKLGKRTDPYNPMSPLLKAEQTPNMPVDFYTLYRHGLISPYVGYFHAFTVTLVALGLEAGEDHIAATSTVHHIFMEGVQPLPAMNSLENACLLTMRLILHCFVRPLREPDDKLTLFCIFGIGHALLNYGVEALLVRVPQAVVWMTMAAASQAKGFMGSSIKVSFDTALRNALLLSHLSDFDQTLRYLDEHFLWVPTMDQDALELWTDGLGLPGPQPAEAIGLGTATA